ncbi:MAG: signal peptidase I [Ruminococcus sp.]|jgi:signal peptidase I|nr:signal peptidase I [Ruminococcus sp.]
MAAADIGNSENENQQDRGFAREIFEWLEAFLTALMLVIIVLIFLLRPAVVDGKSMEPTLHDGDRLIFTDIGFTPAQGDIVVVDSEGLGKFIVKRVIATAGQTLDIDFVTGKVTVDGTVLEENYILADTLRDEGGQTYPLVVPENSVFVMGDNRMNSTDSRDSRVGFINDNDIYGKVIFRIYPFTKMGTVN